MAALSTWLKEWHAVEPGSRLSGWWLVSKSPQPLKFCTRLGREFCLSNPQSPVTRSVRFRPLILQLYLQHLTRNPQPSSAPLPPFSDAHSHSTIASFIASCFAAAYPAPANSFVRGHFLSGALPPNPPVHKNLWVLALILLTRALGAPKPKRDSFHSCLPSATHPTTTHPVIVWSRCFTATIIAPSPSQARLSSRLLYD